MADFRHALGLGLAAACPASAQQQWTSVRLHPEAAFFSYVHAVSATEQFGTLRDIGSSSDLPVIWRGTSVTWTPLVVGTGITGDGLGMSGEFQVGRRSYQASLWQRTPESRVNLHPPQANYSEALAVRGKMQVGRANFGGIDHATLWRGSAASFVDLQPPGAHHSYAYATDGTLQGGEVWFTEQTWWVDHAAIWNGSAASFVDLNPAGRNSSIRGMVAGTQVGWVHFPLGDHAAVWHGIASSWIDLNPPSWTTRFFATTGTVHVGEGGLSGAAHALINFGAVDSWLDLHQFLPPGYGSFSGAYAVYQDGPAIYVGGYATRNGGDDEAFLWIGSAPCYPNCDQSSAAPALNVSDFSCFLQRFTAGDGYANCDRSTAPPLLNVADFTCYLQRFAQGCP
jgi:hypothetical protein